MDKIRPRHDQLFRKALEVPMVAHELLETHMPPELFAMMDKSTIKVEKGSFIEQDLAGKVTDVLLSAKFNGKQGYIYAILEHQSTVDHFMAFRLFDYMISICKRHLKKRPKPKRLPLVYPLIIYNGKKPYTAARNIWELFEDEINAREFWIRDHNVVDVRQIPDEEIKEKQWAGIMKFFLKHIFERDLAEKWKEWSGYMPDFVSVDMGQDYLQVLFCYTLTRLREEDIVIIKEALREKLTEEEGEAIMESIAEVWFKQGEARGIDLGKAEGVSIGRREEAIEIAERMLANGLSPALVLEVTELSETVISQILMRYSSRNKN